MTENIKDALLLSEKLGIENALSQAPGGRERKITYSQAVSDVLAKCDSIMSNQRQSVSFDRGFGE